MPNKPNYLIFKNRKELFEKVSVNKKPIPGTYYTVPKGGWIDTISLKAYGYDRNRDIIKANEQLLKDRAIEPVTGLPYIHPNDILWLPKEIGQQEDETIR